MMLTFAYYLLKVSVCSGLLYGYYLLALRNKKFHQYNRFYLLLTVLLSFIIPLLKIRFWTETAPQEMPAIKLLKVVAMRDAIAEQSLTSAFGSWLVNNVFLVIFCLVSITFLAVLTAGIIRIGLLIRSNTAKSWNNVNFIFTEAKGTPFSFFKYIFWNKNINLQTEEGKHILEHELTHVHENHSADKLFIHAALIIGWINPFFWIIRKELSMIHEFIADEKAISDGDVSTFSAMLLKTAYPQHSFTTLVNSFFHSPIKRRLIMFTTSKKPRYSYLRKLMILPLLSFVIVFFSFKIQDTQALKAKGILTQNQKPIKKVNSAGEKMNSNTNDADTNATAKTLVILDGVEISWKDFYRKDITDKIKSINVFNGKAAIEKFGEKGVNGVMEVSTVSQSLKDEIKAKTPESTNNNSDTIEARFPGGDEAWKKFLETNLNANVPVLKDKAPAGIYTVKLEFVVTETGEIKNIAATKIPDHCPSCAIEAVRVIKAGPKWVPATINGKKAISQLVQFLSFQVEGK